MTHQYPRTFTPVPLILIISLGGLFLLLIIALNGDQFNTASFELNNIKQNFIENTEHISSLNQQILSHAEQLNLQD